MPTRIVTLGSNSSGQLGIGHTEDVDTPTPCLFSTDLHPNEAIVQFAAGGNHTILLTSRGRVFAAGSNESGRACLPISVTQSEQFDLVELLEESKNDSARITHIAATWEASIFVVDDTRIYTCGRGAKGELGAGDEQLSFMTPMLVLDLSSVGQGERVSTLAASVSHAVFATASGRVFGWGACRKGELGSALSAQKVSWTVQEIRIGWPVRMVAAGRDHTCLADTSGRVELLGRYKSRVEASDSSGLDYVDEIASGWGTVILREGARLTSLWSSDSRQSPPPDLPSMAMFAAGSEHTVGLSTSGELLAWGWGEHGNCGRPAYASNLKLPWNVVDVDLNSRERVTFLGGGCATSFIVVENIDRG